MKKDYWLRENVLKPIWDDFRYGFNPVKHDIFDMNLSRFTYDNFKTLLKKYGKSNKQIAEEIVFFINNEGVETTGSIGGVQFLSEQAKKIIRQGYTEPEFYGYYADYDWVLFCSLFGRMIDLPKGFPWYCIDLKQELDKKALDFFEGVNPGYQNLIDKLKSFKTHPDYPKQENEHNALADAKWNKELYNFLTNL